MSIRRLWVFVLFLSLFGVTFATLSADTFIGEVQKKQATLSPTAKQAYLKKTWNAMLLMEIRARKDVNQLQTIAAIKYYLSGQMIPSGSGKKVLVSTGASSKISPKTSSSSSTGYSLPNVDMKKVRDVWLSLHNTERKTKGLGAYAYNMQLEGTAFTWGNYLARIGSATHKRKSGDGYYSYDSIKQRFENQGVSFATEEKNGQTIFTENLGWGMYSCKKSDCTDTLIKSIKTTRSFFMSEKGKKYRPHYNAVMGDYDNVGLGIGLSNGKYYLVSHYAQTLQ